MALYSLLGVYCCVYTATTVAAVPMQTSSRLLPGDSRFCFTAFCIYMLLVVAVSLHVMLKTHKHHQLLLALIPAAANNLFYHLTAVFHYYSFCIQTECS